MHILKPFSREKHKLCSWRQEVSVSGAGEIWVRVLLLPVYWLSDLGQVTVPERQLPCLAARKITFVPWGCCEEKRKMFNDRGTRVHGPSV